jgi:putative ABC transport system substrate-binding protein
VVLAVGIGAIGACFDLWTQKNNRLVQLGYVGNSSPALEAAQLHALRRGLAEHGYIEGKNIFIQYRWAEGRSDVYPQLISELLALNVDLLVVSGTSAALAAKKLTNTLPIVIAAVGDAVGMGIVDNLRRPGGNITGLTSLTPQLEGKFMQILRELAPSVKKIGLLTNPSNPLAMSILNSIHAAADSLQLTTRIYEVLSAEALETAFAAIRKDKLDAINVFPDRSLLAFRKQIVQFAKNERLPAIYPFAEFVEEGGLFSYGPDFPDMFRRAAGYVAKILRGTKPGALPLEQPIAFEMTINMRTANLLRIRIPQSLLLQATKVIE